MSTSIAQPVAQAASAAASDAASAAVSDSASAAVSDAAIAAASAPVDQWGAAPAAASNDFLGAAHSAVSTGIDWWHPFNDAVIPLSDWVGLALSWVVTHFRPAFQAIRVPINYLLSSVELGLQSMPQLLMLLLIFLIAWRVNGRKLAIGSVIAFVLIGLIGAWSEAMVTLALVLTSLIFCILIGLPLGIAVARSDRLQEVMRPGLDAMQTTPAFVYLVPVVMLFGIGNVPGVVVTIIFALAPLIRLTNLGIRQVRPDLIEASRSFGASPWQLLVRVQLPLALPTIMAGVNQALMLSLSMVVIASMIAVGGLGQMVLRGIGRLDMGLATVGGVGIVLMAIVLDRMTQSMGQVRKGA
ncbi:glycine betaine/L-proline ABC transporter permease ProW [Janthinobacterium sp. PC23-8]|uniref:glycine betaine/L-proline ABC transporter permease ProW n=1 Tax=Janthinobacterium sp. PC23-8 TaxID=2012679 RepID=UPI000B964A21|nr:glycine betaine/L-proline ABC transporter permease ProW [Janthinobacterium sp. PC23-8]OYO29250.1 proline/betaine ABC transporter permease ProW [Janthinobacterium sp. PC23-8]